MDPTYVLWMCDLAILVAALGFLLRSGTMITAQLTLLIAMHLGWSVDFFAFLWFDTVPIGSTSYMFFHSLTFGEKLISCFNHLAVVPLALYGACVLGAPRRAWLFQAGVLVATFLLTILLTDPTDRVNWIFGVEVPKRPLSATALRLYYVAMTVLLPFLVFWPTNWLVRRFAARFGAHGPDGAVGAARRPSMSFARGLVIALAGLAVTTGLTVQADRKCALDADLLLLDESFRSSLRALPPVPRTTRIDRCVSAEGDELIEVTPCRWKADTLPTDGARQHVDARATLADVELEELPAVGYSVGLFGRRSVPGSVVWAYVAYDDFYFSTSFDRELARADFELWIGVGSAAGPAATEVYAFGVVEVVDGRIVARSAHHLVQRRPD